MMRNRLCSVLAANGVAIAVWMAAAPAGAQTSLVSFYPTAHATIAGPPAADSMRVTCSERLTAEQSPLRAAVWMSLLAPPGQPAWIVALTTEPIRKPGDALSTTPRYGPLPTAKVFQSSTLDWGWIWDRNGDGRVDYVAFLQNAHPVLPNPVPDTFPVPTRKPDGSYTMTMPLLHAMIDRAQMVFRHYADDDFNGTADGAVVEEFDAQRPMFVRDWVAALSSKRDGAIDEAWAFYGAITDTLRAIAPGADGQFLLPATNETGVATEPANERLAYGARLLGAVNGMIERCGPQRGAVRRP